MGLRDRLGGGKKEKESGAASQPQRSQGKQRGGRSCMYGHPVQRGQKMCEHRHWVG